MERREEGREAEGEKGRKEGREGGERDGRREGEREVERERGKEEGRAITTDRSKLHQISLTEAITSTGFQNGPHIPNTARREIVIVALLSISCSREHDVITTTSTRRALIGIGVMLGREGGSEEGREIEDGEKKGGEGKRGRGKAKDTGGINEERGRVRYTID